MKNKSIEKEMLDIFTDKLRRQIFLPSITINVSKNKEPIKPEDILFTGYTKWIPGAITKISWWQRLRWRLGLNKIKNKSIEKEMLDILTETNQKVEKINH